MILNAIASAEVLNFEISQFTTSSSLILSSRTSTPITYHYPQHPLRPSKVMLTLSETVRRYMKTLIHFSVFIMPSSLLGIQEAKTANSQMHVRDASSGVTNQKIWMTINNHMIAAQNPLPRGRR